MSDTILTGKARYREHKRLFRTSVLVLQIGEESKLGAYIDHNGDDLAPPSWDENKIITTWRDAKVEDLTYIKGG